MTRTGSTRLSNNCNISIKNRTASRSKPNPLPTRVVPKKDQLALKAHRATGVCL